MHFECSTFCLTQPAATRPLAIQKDGTWFTYGYDITKNICEVFGPAGYIRTAYSYAPFGAVSASGDVSQPFQWSSEHYDSELGLVYYNYRHYSPSFGRFLSRDPIQEQGGLNLYAFVKNSPNISMDLLGRVDITIPLSLILVDVELKVNYAHFASSTLVPSLEQCPEISPGEMEPFFYIKTSESGVAITARMEGVGSSISHQVYFGIKSECDSFLGKLFKDNISISISMDMELTWQKPLVESSTGLCFCNTLTVRGGASLNVDLYHGRIMLVAVAVVAIELVPILLSAGGSVVAGGIAVGAGALTILS